MPADYTRDTFDPAKRNVGVLMQQGRVQLDADWNEAQSIARHRDETEARDVIGACGAPLFGGGFGLSPLDGGRDLGISAGRFYIDGILCELNPIPVVAALVDGSDDELQLESLWVDGAPLRAGDWVEVFENGPEVPPGTGALLRVELVDEEDARVTLKEPVPAFASPVQELRLRRVPTFLTQPDFPQPGIDGDNTSPPASIISAAGDLSLPAGLYLAYLRCWQREVTALDDPLLRETALGGPDTTARLRTACQVRLLKLNVESPPAVSCESQLPEWDALIQPSSGRLNARTLAPSPDEDPCELPPTAGYRRLENQLYRVEIHDGGDRDQATFKWSRDNGSIETMIVDIDPLDGKRVLVTSIGKDEILGFQQGQWVELIGDKAELNGELHALGQIDDVSPDENVIVLKVDVSAYRGVVRKLRRWDHSEPVNGDGLLSLMNGDADGWIDVEGNIQIQFSEGTYRSGDFWLIPARTMAGEIEWPPFQIPNLHPSSQPPHGTHHHFSRLALVHVSAAGIEVHDCRCRFAPLNQLQILSYVSGDGQEAMPLLPSVADARVALAQPLVVGVANAHCRNTPVKVRFRVNKGSGKVASSAGPPHEDEIIITADDDGLVQFFWELGADLTTAEMRARNLPSQQVEAQLLDENDAPIQLPIRFNGNLSIAEQVAYDPGDCAALAGQATVQTAIDRLARQVSLHKVSGDAQQGLPGQVLNSALIVVAASRCAKAPNLTVQFRVISGGGTVTPGDAITSAGANAGRAACEWTLGAASVTQEVEATLVSDDPARPVTEPSKVRFTASLESGANDPDPAHVIGVRIDKPERPLANDETLLLEHLRAALIVLCDRTLRIDTLRDPVSVQNSLFVRGQPTCFVTVEVPYPLIESDFQDWDIKDLIGYRPVVLNARVDLEGPSEDDPPETRQRISWRLAPGAGKFLDRVLKAMLKHTSKPDKLLLRLTLNGNFIWHETGGFLDGESFRSPDPSGLILPSGDQRRGGAFEMWFWLVPQLSPPVITVQPVSVPAVIPGSSVTFSVTASGTGPFSYQWLKNGAPIAGATTAKFTINAATAADQGSNYSVRVANEAGSVTSNNVTLTLAAQAGGGVITFANRGGELNVPVFRADGQTRVSSAEFSAQLLIGKSQTNLQPVGSARPFLTGAAAGYWRAETVTLEMIPPGATVFAQVRVWPKNVGSFEAALAAGAPIGVSNVFEVTAGPASAPGTLQALPSFRLSA
jgi:hypothetical protein